MSQAKHELVTDAARAAANLGDAHDWRGREAQDKLAPNSTIVVGTNMLIGGLLKVIVHRAG